MCGRFTLINLADFVNLFPWILPPDSPPPARYNIAPTQPVAAVPNTPEHKVDFFHFGLIPSWAKDASIGSRMINARAETLAEKPAFRTPLRRRRCLIPADGFYEWRMNPGGGKTPLHIRLKSGRPFAFAGLWDVWHSSDGSAVPSCTIITTEANSLLQPIHDRMPVILPEAQYKQWLDPEERPPEELAGLLRPYPAHELTATPVSPYVNSARNDSPRCVAAIDVPPPGERPAKTPSRRRPSRSADETGSLFPDSH